MDPLSITASITGILSLTITTCQGLINYYASWRDADSDIAAFTTSAQSLIEILQYIERGFEANTIPGERSSHLGSSLQDCETATRSLQKKLRKVETVSSTRTVSTLEAQFRRSLYPFRKGTLIRLKEIVEDLRQNLLVVLECVQIDRSFDQLLRLEVIDRDVKTIKDVSDRQFRVELRKWLNAPDFTATHDGASTAREPGTGEWFLSSEEFKEWLEAPSVPSLLWLQGDTGCGKTVLCSAAVKAAQDKCEGQHESFIAYYYFDSDLKATCTVEGLFRSLVKQFASQNDRCYDHLSNLWDECNGGMRQPSLSELVRVVQEMFLILKENQVFIIIDGLDECQELDRLSLSLNTIICFNKDFRCCFHRFLIFSRRRKKLQDNLKSLSPTVIEIGGSPIDADVELFVTTRLSNDPWWARWPESVRQQIRATLTNKAQGMFQYVKCHLDGLKKSKNLSMLRTCLGEMPLSLEATYQKSLGDIDPLYFEYSHRMLQWLCFSMRPPTVNEINDVLATRLGEDACFEPESRFFDPNDVQDLCPGLVSIAIDPSYSRHIPVIKLSHSSVRDYLLSDHQGALAKYNITDKTAQHMIAAVCLAYLLTFRKPRSLSIEDIRVHFPLARYAAEHWVDHVRGATENFEMWTLAESSKQTTGSFTEAHTLDCLVQKLLIPCDPSGRSSCTQLASSSEASATFKALLRENVEEEHNLGILALQPYNTDSPKTGCNPETKPHGLPPVATISADDLESGDIWALEDMVWIPGLRRAVEGNKQDIIDSTLRQIQNDVNVSMRLAKRLEVFVRAHKNETVAKIMHHLNNVCPGEMKTLCSTAIVPAVQSANVAALDVLMSFDLDPNARLESYSWEDDTALTAAIVHKDPVSLRKLIAKGADVNLRTHRGKTPLYLAVKYEAHPKEAEIVEALVRAGANVNARSTDGRTPLHICYNPEIVRTLLAKEDILVHMIDDFGYTAFENALSRRADWKVAALLEKDQSLAYHQTRSIANLWRVETAFLKHILETVDINLDATDIYGDTLLTKVTEFIDLEKVNLLLAHSANATYPGRNTFGASHFVALYNNSNLSEIFTSHQIPIRLLPQRTKTALHVAAERDDDLFIEECIFHCEPTIFALQDEAGRTPLHVAIEHSNTYALRRLGRYLERNVLDDEGRNPIALAKQCGNNFHVSFLSSVGFTD